MPTYETTYSSGYAGDLRTDRALHLSWSSIWGGTLLGWGALVLLSLIGALIGFAALDPFASAPGANVGVGSYLWGALELVACAGAGGFLAARLAGSRRRRDAAAHAAIGWALSMVAGALLAIAVAPVAAHAAAEATVRRPAAARTNDRAARPPLDRGARIGTAAAAVGTGTALISLVAALAGGIAAASAAGGHRGREAPRGRGYGADDRMDGDQPTILPPVH